MSDPWDEGSIGNGSGAEVGRSAEANAVPGTGVAFVDTTAMVALVDSDDRSHAAMVEAYRSLVSERYRLFTTDFAIAETFDLLRTGVGATLARQWLRDSTLEVYHVDQADLRRARRAVLRQSSGPGLSFADAISLVVMERFEVGDALAADPEFLAGAG